MSEPESSSASPLRWLAGLSWLILCLAVAYFAVRASRLVDRFDQSIEWLGGAEYLLEPTVEQFFDRLNESGYDRQPIDPDDPLLGRRTIVISEGVQERLASRVIERLHYLDAIDPGTPIELRVATSGGWVDSAFAIVDTMRSLESPVNVTALGGCYSAGTVILAGATGERTATPNALLSVHVNDYYRDGGPYDADTHELARFREIYLRRSKVPGEWFEEPGERHYYFDAKRALELGLIDRLAEPVWDEPAAPPEETRDAA